MSFIRGARTFLGVYRGTGLTQTSVCFVLNRTLRTEVFQGNGDRDDYLNTAIVITDGQSNVNKHQTLPEAEELRKFADVFVVGVTEDVDYQELLVRPGLFGWSYSINPKSS